MLTAEFAGSAIGGLPAFIGALALIFGVLVAGSDYAFDTWKTILVQRPSRVAVFAGKLTAIAAGCLATVATLLAVSAASSLVVTGIEGAAATWPPATEILTDLAAGWMIGFMWAMLGVALAVGLRSVALPVGIGLVWMLAIQNLMTGLAAPLLGWVDAVQEWLPGPRPDPWSPRWAPDRTLPASPNWPARRRPYWSSPAISWHSPCSREPLCVNEISPEPA